MWFEGRTAVITGASSGIGQATTQRFLAEGARVIAVSDRPDELATVAAELGSLGEIHRVECDVGDAEQVAAMAARVAELGGCDVLVNNAGIWNEREFLDIEHENWDRIIRVNLTGPFLCSQALVPQIRDRGGGAIVNTASTNGLSAEPRLAHYNASKGGLVMLTRTMSLDLCRFRIRVNAVAPGVIHTPLIAHILEAQQDGHFGTIPWGRVGQPEEIAACIAFLASDDASYVTGEIFVVDGGQLAINGQLPDEHQSEIATRLAGEGRINQRSQL